MNKLLIIAGLAASLTVLSVPSEAMAQQWMPVAPPDTGWRNRDKEAFYMIGGTEVYVCPPNFPYPESRVNFGGSISIGCSDGNSTDYFYDLEFSEQITMETDDLVQARYSDSGWLTVAVYSNRPVGSVMDLGIGVYGQEEVIQIIVGAGYVTVGYYDPQTGTVMAVRRRAPGTRLRGRRVFYQGPVPGR